MLNVASSFSDEMGIFGSISWLPCYRLTKFGINVNKNGNKNGNKNENKKVVQSGPGVLVISYSSF